MRVGSVGVGIRAGSQRVGGSRIGVVHVEGQVVCLGRGEGDGVVNAEELVEEAGAFAALDVAAAAASVVVGVERHGVVRTCESKRRFKRRLWSMGHF